MRKFLSPKFWSLGTPLGSLGPGSQADLHQRACQSQILFIWGPCKAPVLVALLGQAKNPKTAWLEQGVTCDLNVLSKICSIKEQLEKSRSDWLNILKKSQLIYRQKK